MYHQQPKVNAYYSTTISFFDGAIFESSYHTLNSIACSKYNFMLRNMDGKRNWHYFWHEIEEIDVKDNLDVSNHSHQTGNVETTENLDITSNNSTDGPEDHFA